MEQKYIQLAEKLHERKQSRLQGRNIYHKSMMTSINQNWRTPQEIYDGLNKEFYFDFDPCPNNPLFDGLSCEWGKSNFINPPYGRYTDGKYAHKSAQDLFVSKAFAGNGQSVNVVKLIFKDMFE